MLFFPTADEDFKYFRNQGYTGSINDMHYKAMGDLGYTGSLNDRIHAYLTATYGSYYEAMRDLRNGTSVFALIGYRVLGINPDLVLDFKNSYYRKSGTASTFSGTITQARASSATMTNSSGTLVTVGNNVPRTGHHVYNGSAWVNEGILHETDARTNLITHSDFSGSWLTFQSTLAEASVTAPDGSQDAYSLTPSTSSSVHYAQFNLTAANGTHTDSVYVKANGYTKFFIRPVHVGASEGDTSDAKFNLTTGEVISYSTDTFTSISIEDVSNGWYRISFGFKTTGTVTTSQVRLQALNNTGAAVFAGDGTSGFYVFAPQREAGPTVSSYIATSGSTATRAAETLIVPAANLPYSSTNMSIQMDGRMSYADTGSFGTVRLFDWTLDANNGIIANITTEGSFDGQIYFTQEAGGVVDNVNSDAFNIGINVPFNIASRHGSGFINGAISGTALTANTTPSALPNLSSTNLKIGFKLMGTISKFRMWDEDLTDTGIEEAST